MQYKWELGIDDLNVCKNGEFMSANDNTNDAPYWKQRSVFVAPFTSSNSWFFDSQFISGTGYQYINRALHVLNNALANVDLDLYQEGRIKIGRSYTVTVVYHITAIGTAPAYGLQIRTGGTVVQTRPATATANPVTYSYTTSGPATTEEFLLQTNTRVTIDIYSVKVEEIFAFQEFEEPIDWVSSGKITLER